MAFKYHLRGEPSDVVRWIGNSDDGTQQAHGFRVVIRTVEFSTEEEVRCAEKLYELRQMLEAEWDVWLRTSSTSTVQAISTAKCTLVAINAALCATSDRQKRVMFALSVHPSLKDTKAFRAPVGERKDEYIKKRAAFDAKLCELLQLIAKFVATGPV
jgi:hypothetical protein